MITFRNVTTHDIELILPMMQEFYAIDQYPFDYKVAENLFYTFLSDKNLGTSWIIEQDHIPVGYVILTHIFSFEYQGKIAFIDELFIQEKIRGKGIGTKTLLFVQEQAALKGLKLLYLEMESHNVAAEKLYRANHFSTHHRQLMKYIPKP